MNPWIIFSEGGPEGHGRYYLPGEEFEGLERPERLPMAGFQRKVGRKAPDRVALIVTLSNFSASCFNQKADQYALLPLVKPRITPGITAPLAL